MTDRSVTSFPSIRPGTGRRRAAALAAVVAGGLMVGLAPTSAHASGSGGGSFLAHLNALRAGHGLRGLVETGDLNAIAAAHSRAMAGKETIFHNSSLTNVVANWQVLGENVGMGPSESAIDSAFDHSPEHYANEVNPAYTQVGIGTASDSRGYLYVTLDFRKPMVTSAPRPAPVPTKAPVRAPAKAPAKGPAKAPAPAHAAPARPLVPLTWAHQGAARRPSTPSAALQAEAAQHASNATTAAAARAASAQAATRAAVAARAAAAARAARAARAVATATGGDPLAQALAFPRTLAALGS